MKKYIVSLLAGISFNLVYGQTLYTENFNNYPIGNLGTDYTGTVPGKGNFGKLRYYHNTTTATTPFTSWQKNLPPNNPSVWCDSREVDYELEYSHEDYFFGAGAPYKINLYMGMGANLWMTSGHVITIGL